MLQKIEMDGNDVLAFEVKGKLTAEDYTETLNPLLKSFRESGKKARVLFQLGPEYDGFTPKAEWEDMKLGLRFLNTFERVALVTDHEWIRKISAFVGSFLPCPIEVFSNAKLDEAKAWLTSGEIGLDQHVDGERGVLTVDITSPLTSENFGILTYEVDNWIARGGVLKGIVVHVKTFPGWQNVGSFIRHFQFVKNHHRKLRRVAISSDGSFAEMIPKLAQHFVEAEVKTFGYDKLSEAQDWVAAAI